MEIFRGQSECVLLMDVDVALCGVAFLQQRHQITIYLYKMQFIIQGSKLIAQRAATGTDLAKYLSWARMERFDDPRDSRLVIQKMLTKTFSGPAGAGSVGLRMTREKTFGASGETGL